MYPTLVEKVASKLRQEHPELICFEGPSLDGEGLFFVLLRPLQIKEFEYYTQVQQRSYEDAKDFACRIAILEIFDSNKNRFVPMKELPLGLYDEAEEIILANSNFSPEGIKGLLEGFRMSRGQTHMQAIAFICRAFPAMSPIEIEAMTATELAKHLSLAEILYESQGEENPFFQIVTEGDVVTEEQQEATVLQDIARQARENDKVMGIKR